MLRDLNSFTWDEFAALDPHELTYVLPIGALEQHGRHLALGADDFIGDPGPDDLPACDPLWKQP